MHAANVAPPSEKLTDCAEQGNMLGTERPTGLAAVFSYLMIGFVAASALVGIGFVAFGFALQAPAKSFVPV